MTLKKNTKLLLVVAAILVVGVAVGAYLKKRYTLPLYNLSAQIEQAEKALAGEGLLLLASLDADYLKAVEDQIYGKALQPELTALDEEEEPSFFIKLQRAGINPYEAISAISGAAYITEEQGFAGALVVHGQFPLESLRAFLEENYKTQPASGYGADAWVVQSENKTSCELSRPWLVLHQDRRLIIVDPGFADKLIARFKDGSAPARDLELWQRFRKERFAGAALFIPKSVPEKGVNPFIRLPAEATRKAVAGFEAVYLGASAKAFPPAGRVSVWLAGYDENKVSKRASNWQNAIQYSKKEWQKMLPAIAAMHDHMKVAVEGSAIMVDVEMDRALVEKLGNIFQELTRMLVSRLFSGLGEVKAAPDAASEKTAPAKEVLAKDLPTYRAQYSLTELQPYSPKLSQFDGGADVASGPFGISLKSIALSEKEEAGIELTIESIGTEIANLGKEVGDRVQLAVTSVQDKADNELLQRESCGMDPNNKPAKASRFGDQAVKNEKTIRLVPSAKPSEIGRIKGYVRLKLPTEVETVTITQPKVGTIIEKNGVKIEITDLGGKSVSYRLSGMMSNFLELRALNVNNQPLENGGWSSMGALFGSGKSVSHGFQGDIKQLQFIFAAENQIKQFPYELDSARPKNILAKIHQEPLKLLPFSVAEFEQGTAHKITPELKKAFLDEVRTGPFIVRLRSIGSFFGLIPVLDLVAPDVKELDKFLPVVKVDIDSVTLREKIRHQPNGENGRWWQNVSFYKPYGQNYLQSGISIETKLKVEPEELESIEGNVVLRAPLSISPLVLEKVNVGENVSMGDFKVVLTKLSRNGFTLMGQSQKTLLLGVEAISTENKPLWINSKQLEPTDEGWKGIFSMSGVPSKIVLYVADKFQEKQYPFTLTVKK